MKLDNRSELPDRFVRRALAWVCGQLDVRVRSVSIEMLILRVGKTQSVTYSRDASGRTNEATATICFERGEPLARRVRYLVSSLGWLVSKHVPDRAWHYNHVLAEFDKRPRALMDDWSLCAGPRASAIDEMVDTHLEYLEANDPAAKAAKRAKKLQKVLRRRQTKAKARLVEWERKRRLANTKVKKYRAKVAYYDKKFADDRTDDASGS